MRNAVFGREKVAVEYLACVAAGEVSGFGNGVEDLTIGCSVDGEVVDGFVENRIEGDVLGLWEHSSDGVGVRRGEGFVLTSVRVST